MTTVFQVFCNDGDRFACSYLTREDAERAALTLHQHSKGERNFKVLAVDVPGVGTLDGKTRVLWSTAWPF